MNIEDPKDREAEWISTLAILFKAPMATYENGEMIRGPATDDEIANAEIETYNELKNAGKLKYNH